MRYAIVTLVMNGNKYVPGAVALAHSARYYSHAKLVCMVTDDVTDRQQLQQAFDEVIQVERITVKGSPLKGKRAQEIYGSWIQDSPTKFQCMGLEQYDKVLFLDADTIIVNHIDDLFSLQTPAGMFDHQVAKKYVINLMYTGENTTIGITNVYNVKHGQKIDSDKIRDLYTNTDQFAVHGGVLLFKTSKFAVEMYKMWIKTVVDKIPAGISSLEEISISLFFVEHGYSWTHIDMSYNVSVFHVYEIFGKKTKVLHYITQYKPWMEDKKFVQEKYPQHLYTYDLWWRMYNQTLVTTYPQLKDRLKDLLGNYLGDRGIEAVDRAWPVYQQAFVHKSINPVVNYELLESYGDRFLAGQYMWILNSTPGIIYPAQITLISNYFQDEDRLKMLAENLGIDKYIQTNEYNSKIISDVMESLIGAIGITWEQLYGKGNLALQTLIRKLYEQYFEIDAENYQTKYQGTISAFNSLVQELRLQTSKIQGTYQIKDGQVLFVLSYDGKIIGKGKSTLDDVTEKIAIKQAETDAKKDSLIQGSLYQLVK